MKTVFLTLIATILVMFLFGEGVEEVEAKVDDPTLIGLWLMDSGDGEVAKDSSQYQNDGTIFDCEWVDGQFGKALDFDGTKSYVEVPDSDSLDIDNDQVSITAWLTQRAPGDTWRTIVSKGPMSGTNENWALFTNIPSEYIHFVITTPGRQTPSSTAGSLGPDEKWHHVAAVYDGETAEIYLDGELVFSQALSGNLVPNDNTLRIGWREASPHVWNGILDEIGVFNRALSEEEVKDELPKAAAVNAKDKLTTTWAELKAY